MAGVASSEKQEKSSEVDADKKQEVKRDTETPGKRSRKQVDFFSPQEVKQTDKLVVKEGKGAKLGDIPNVAFHLSKLKGSDELLEDLHQLLYRRKGKQTTRKKDILAFSGFPHAGEEAERNKDVERLSRWKLDHLHRLMDLLDVSRGSGDKESKVVKVLDFLDKPEKLSTVDIAAKENAKKEKAQKKRAREEKTKDGTSKKNSKAKVEAKKPTATKSKKPAARSKDETEAGATAESESDDELPLNELAKAEPSNKVIKAAVDEMLEETGVQDMDIKQLCSALEKKYKWSLSNNKETRNVVKAAAILFCQEHAEQEEEEQGDEEEGEEEEAEGEEGAEEAEENEEEEDEAEGAKGAEDPGDEPMTEAAEETAQEEDMKQAEATAGTEEDDKEG